MNDKLNNSIQSKWEYKLILKKTLQPEEYASAVDAAAEELSASGFDLFHISHPCRGEILFTGRKQISGLLLEENGGG